MGNYENIVKIEEIRKKIDESDYLSAQKILDTVDIKKVKNSADMSLIAEVLTQNERYNEAMDMLLKIYQKAKTRKTLYQLIEISIIKNNTADGEMYLLEYQKIAPKDFYKYVFRYKIDKLKGLPYVNLIDTLETLKKTEYIEQWAYELAKLYYKAGMEEECIKECSDIVLWFGDGIYVEKAKMLRAYYSGETNKDEMMEELKRMAKEDRFVDNTDDHQEKNEEYVDEVNDQEDSVYEMNEYETEDETTEMFTNDLKKDIENIFMEDHENPANDQEYYDDRQVGYNDTGYTAGYSENSSNYSKDEWEEEEETSNSEWEEEEETKGTAIDENFNEPSHGMSESEIAEQEVEETIYQLLQEEDLDEEDKKIKEMSNELGLSMEDIFGNFLHVKAVKKQLIKSLEEILRERTKSIQMIITGTSKSGKTTLAKDLTIYFNKMGKLKSTKVARINADKMNSVDILSKKGTLRDCCLIIENASELKRTTIDNLIELIQYFHGDIIVIFEENKKNMNKLFRECPKLMDLFKNRIHLPQYTPEDLLGFAYASLKQQDYRLNSKSQSILQSRIYHIAKFSEPNKQLEAIQELIKAIMTAADVRIGKQLPSLAEKGRLKDVDIMYVLPEDFTPKL